MLHVEQVDDRLASLRLAFERGENLAAFAAYILSAEYDRDPPDWAREYVIDALGNLVFTASAKPGAGPGEVGRALGLKRGLATSRDGLFARKRAKGGRRYIAQRLAEKMIDERASTRSAVLSGFEGLSEAQARKLLIQAAGRPSGARALMVEWLTARRVWAPDDPTELVNAFSRACSGRGARKIACPGPSDALAEFLASPKG